MLTVLLLACAVEEKPASRCGDAAPCDGACARDASALATAVVPVNGRLSGDASELLGLPGVFVSRDEAGATTYPNTLDLVTLSGSGSAEVLVTVSLDSPETLVSIAELGVGDVDGDDVPDLLLGVRASDYGGELHLLRGPLTSGTIGAATVLLDGPPDARFAEQLALIPDRDGDGVDDLVVTADGMAGVVFLVDVPGVIDGTASYDDQMLTGTADVAVGRGYAAGDLDGDGLADAMVLGSTRILVIPSDWEWPGRPEDAPTSLAGGFSTVASVGDFTGDGYDDLAAVPGAAGYVPPERPLIEVYAGPFAHEVGEEARVTSVVPTPEFNTSRPTLHLSADLEEDGLADLLLGNAPDQEYSDAETRYPVYRVPGGSCGAYSLEHTFVRLQSPATDNALRQNLTPTADMDGDGFADLVVDGVDLLHVFSSTVFEP